MIITKKQLIAQLSKLISIKSLTGNFDENQKVLDYIESIASKKTTFKRIRNKNAEILLIGNNPTKLLNPDIGYLVHSDVVSATASMWKMKINGNIATGRGVSDMKYSIPIGVAILNKLVKNKNLTHNTSFTFAITTDEESGGFQGSQYLANNLKFRPKVLIVPDGGADFTFINKSKGIQQIKLTKIGKAAHSSTPWNGENAIVPLCNIVTQLMQKYTINNKKNNWKTTLNIGKIRGGVSINQVCPKATLELDFRFPETQSSNDIIKEVTKTIENIDKNIIMEIGFAGNTTYTDTSAPIVKKFIRIMEAEIGRKVVIEGTNGGSDSRYFASYNIPILMMRPAGDKIHEDGEWLDLNSTLKFAEGLWKFVI